MRGRDGDGGFLLSVDFVSLNSLNVSSRALQSISNKNRLEYLTDLSPTQAHTRLRRDSSKRRSRNGLHIIRHCQYRVLRVIHTGDAGETRRCWRRVRWRGCDSQARWRTWLHFGLREDDTVAERAVSFCCRCIC